jgi:hypothetical protein
MASKAATRLLRACLKKNHHQQQQQLVNKQLHSLITCQQPLLASLRTAALPATQRHLRRRLLHTSARRAEPAKPPSQPQAADAAKGAAAEAASKGGEAEPHRSLEHLTEMYSDVEAKVMAKMRTHNKGRFRTIALSTLLAVIWVTNVFGKEIRRFVGGQTAEVARETLKHESIQIQTQELATAVVNTLLNDPEVLAGTSMFLQLAANNPETQVC